MDTTLDSFLKDDPTIKKVKLNFIAKEKYKHYQGIWSNLMNDTLETTFKLEFNKQFNPKHYERSFYSDKRPMNQENMVKLLRSCGWRTGGYDKQHWGVWLHSLSPYQGRIKPAFAHWLIKIFSTEGDMIWDPFCGIGTVPFESALLGRRSIGTDLNPYAYLIASAKLNVGTIKEHLAYLKNIKDIDVSGISTDHVPDWIKAYFHERTLKEILYLNDKFRDDNKFLHACLMGILHGNRPGYLSVYTGCIIPMKPRPADHPKYRIDKDKPEYRPVIPRMAAKVMRMFENELPNFPGNKILNEDARHTSLAADSVDCVISSPPYYDTLDYVGTNKVRLYFLGLDIENQNELKDDLIQDKGTYIEEMIKVGNEVKRVLKPEHYLVFVLGDVHYTKKSINTAEEVSKIYKDLDYEFVDMVGDEIPGNKTASRTKRQKFDRILVMKNKK
nr:DNA methyltransferase [Candidatus Sigynarchaeota archaeon]